MAEVKMAEVIIVIILEGCAPLGALCVMLKHLVYLET